jgi:hypothetical protein
VLGDRGSHASFSSVLLKRASIETVRPINVHTLDYDKRAKPQAAPVSRGTLDRVLNAVTEASRAVYKNPVEVFARRDNFTKKVNA